MGNIGPSDWSSNQIIFRTDLVTHEDKATNHTNLVRTQTCVILVMGDTKDAGDDDDARDIAKQGGDGGVVGGGEEGGDDYVISGDGEAVIHGARMVPFHMNMPALIG